MKWSTLSLAPGSDIVGELEARLGTGPGPHLVDGFGELRDPLLWPRLEGGERTEVQLDGVWDLVSLRGAGESATSMTLVALLCRQSASGPETRGGVLAGGSVVSATVRLGSGSDAVLSQPPPRSQPVVALQAAAPVVPTPTPRPAEAAAPPAVSAPAIALPAAPKPAPEASPSAPTAPSAPAPVFGSSGMLPKRPVVVTESEESYPEEGDMVTHFAFGRCVVASSDGERLRLQQERDGRVREVALSMLRLNQPTVGEDGKRHWELGRKN
jgi:hypothetical protein